MLSVFDLAVSHRNGQKSARETGWEGNDVCYIKMVCSCYVLFLAWGIVGSSWHEAYWSELMPCSLFAHGFLVCKHFKFD